VTHIHELPESLAITGFAAEREGFEPSVGSHLRLISSQRYKRAFTTDSQFFVSVTCGKYGFVVPVLFDCG